MTAKFAPRPEPIETLHLAALIDRLRYLDRLDRERGGPTPSRAAEQNALRWAIDRLVELDPKLAALLPRAETRADEVERRRW